MTIDLKTKIQNDVKDAMRAKEQKRLDAMRLLLAAIKQREVDERIILDDGQIADVIRKMIKQRKESIAQYEAAKRDDLVKQEQFEITLLLQYLPPSLDTASLTQIVKDAIATSGASSVKDMGKVMSIVKPKIQGQADMSDVSAIIKELLAN